MEKPFQWNPALCGEIAARCDRAGIVTGNVFNIAEPPYRALGELCTEEYFTHPDGPWPGTKEELKKADAYRSKKLVQNEQTVTCSTKAIQKAVDDAAAAGGGKVVIPAGVWYTGALELKSEVELHLEEQAVLRFMRNKTNAFYPVRLSRWEGVECMNFSPFIYADRAENIAITGRGTLDGAADEFNWMPWKFGFFGETDQQMQRERLFGFAKAGTPAEQRVFDDRVSTLRPPFIQFYHSKRIRIEDVHIANSPFWEINPVLCEDVLVRGVHIETNLYNNDGVDPESSKNVCIEDCYFLTGDDCIAIKSGRNEDGRRIGVPSENILIRRNRFANGHGGITIGSEISGGVRNVFAEDNAFDSPNLDYPIRFKTNAQRGGELVNIYVRRSRVNKSRLAAVHADFFYEEGHNGPFLPHLANIVIEDLQTVEGGSMDAQNAFYLKGFEDAPIENFTLRNVDLRGVQGHAVLQNVRNMQLENVSINGHSLDNQMLNVGNETDTHSL